MSKRSNPRWDDEPAEPWEGNSPCQDCGARNIIWTAPHELWESVMECVPGIRTGGIICPTCFVRRAYAKGITQYVWYLVPKPHGMDPKVPLEGRVTPTYHHFTGLPTELLRQWYACFLNPSGQWASWPPKD